MKTTIHNTAAKQSTETVIRMPSRRERSVLAIGGTTITLNGQYGYAAQGNTSLVGNGLF